MKIIAKELIYKGFLSLFDYKVQTKSGDNVSRLFVSRESDTLSSDAVAALVYNKKKDKYIFVKQFRIGTNDHLLEVPAGCLEKNEDPSKCIVREIEEETGYKTDSIKDLGVFYVSPASFSEKIYLYYVEVTDQVSSGGGVEDEHEEIEIIEMTTNEIENYQFRDMKTQMLINYVI